MIAFVSHMRIGLKTHLGRQRLTGRGGARGGGAQKVIIEIKVKWMRRIHDLSREIQGGRVEGKGRFTRDLN